MAVRVAPTMTPGPANTITYMLHHRRFAQGRLLRREDKKTKEQRAKPKSKEQV